MWKVNQACVENRNKISHKIITQPLNGLQEQDVPYIESLTFAFHGVFPFPKKVKLENRYYCDGIS